MTTLAPTLDMTEYSRNRLENRGYSEIPSYDGLAAGVRIRHVSEQFPDALREGTATVIAVYKMPSHRDRVDVQAIIETKTLGSPIIRIWSHYLCRVVEP